MLSLLFSCSFWLSYSSSTSFSILSLFRDTPIVFVPIRQSVLIFQVEKRISENCHWKQSCQQCFFKCIRGHCYSHFISDKKLCQSCCIRLLSGTQSFIIWCWWCSRRSCTILKISGWRRSKYLSKLEVRVGSWALGVDPTEALIIHHTFFLHHLGLLCIGILNISNRWSM